MIPSTRIIRSDQTLCTMPEYCEPLNNNGAVTPAAGAGRLAAIAVMVFACALVTRLIVLVQLREASPLFDHPVVDAWRYDSLAKQFLRTGTWPEPGAFFQPPAYPLFLAVVYALFGESPTWVRLVQSLLGSLSCVFLAILAARLYTKKIGLASGLIMALYGPLIYFDLDLLAPVLIVFFSCLGLLLLQLAHERDSPLLLAPAGFCLGAALVTWPIIGLFCGAVLALLAWQNRQNPASALRYLAVFMTGLALPILPVLAHNVMHGEWVLISTNGGINFYIGNNPDWQQTVAMRPGYPWEKIVTMPFRLSGEEAVRQHGPSALYFKESLHYITTRPLSYLQAQLTKLYQLFYGFEIMRNTDLYFFKQYAPLLDRLIWQTPWLKFPFGLLIPFGLLGLLSEQRRPGSPRYSLLYLATVSFGLLLFFITARYRIVLVPVLALYASLGAARIITAARRKDIKHVLLSSVSLFLLTGLANLDLFNQERVVNGPAYRAQAPFTLGRINLDQNKPETALYWLAQSTRIDPFYPDAWVDTGRARFMLGNIPGAIAAMNQAASAAPDYPLPSYNLALIFDRDSMPRDTALRYYREFLDKSEAYFEENIRGRQRLAFARQRITALKAAKPEAGEEK